MRIAIDGPAQVGKSSTAQLLARKLNYPHLNSGNIYRTITAYILEKNISCFSSLRNKKFSIKNNSYFFDKIDLTSHLRSDAVNRSVAKYAQYREIREIVRDIQHGFIRENENIIIDGRDIGTNVCREAELKIYLIANIEVRVKRFSGDFDEILKRDENDMHRKYGALRKADDAITVDNSNMTLEETVDFILGKIKK